MTDAAEDFLEQEKKKDPIERIVSMLEATMPKPGALATADPRIPKPSAMVLQVRKIENGFILGVQEQPYGGMREIYIQDPAVLKEKAAALVETFAKEAFQAYPPIHGADAFKDDAVGA